MRQTGSHGGVTLAEPSGLPQAEDERVRSADEDRLHYERWQRSVPAEITRDALWNVTVYRLALYLADLAWEDVTRLAADHRTLGLSAQLYAAVGSIGANTAEGFFRGSAKDRARFYEYALGSARESRDWYFKARHVLGDELARRRITLVTRIVQLLLAMVPQQRGYAIREESVAYSTGTPSEMSGLGLQDAPVDDIRFTNDV
jgi:four helix bundle protein